ncbi:MAG: hypothetical protein EXR70_16985 [Deltaproteobacteria bacterium]|nr:hypothetical protein [Deltaproteobacteria bacterium]
MSEANSAITGLQVGQIFFQRAAELGERTFIKIQKGAGFEAVTWNNFATLVRQVLLGLVSLGLQRQAVLVGDRRPFIAALLVADRQKISASCHRELASLSAHEIHTALWSQVERVNERLEQYERIRQIIVMDGDFPAEVRSINHFQNVKVERSVVSAGYQSEIEAIYSGGKL